MTIRSHRAKRDRIHRHRSELDWFAEDPWGEPDSPTSEDGLDDWQPALWGSTAEEVGDGDSTDEEEVSASGEVSEEGYDDWGPIRPRRGRQRHPR